MFVKGQKENRIHSSRSRVDIQAQDVWNKSPGKLACKAMFGTEARLAN
jgi:hypothetical protein